MAITNTVASTQPMAGRVGTNPPDATKDELDAHMANLDAGTVSKRKQEHGLYEVLMVSRIEQTLAWDRRFVTDSEAEAIELGWAGSTLPKGGESRDDYTVICTFLGAVGDKRKDPRPI